MDIHTIYLDMDGVLTNFIQRCRDIDAISGRVVDWVKVEEKREEFWSNMEWLDGGKQFYTWLCKYCREQDIDLCILSAVHYEEGVNGKIEWLRKHTQFKYQDIIIVSKGKEKQKYSTKGALLIDDYRKNIEQFISAGGKGVLYKNALEAKEDVIEKLM
jgi:5'(3')-deoxyribonucleotidase